MTNDVYTNIKFPFESDLKGKFLALNRTPLEQAKSDLALLITTQVGTRLRKRDYGTNLQKYIFEPLDDTTKSALQSEIVTTVDKYLKSIKIKSIEATTDEGELFVGLTIYYEVSDGVLKQSDRLSMTF